MARPHHRKKHKHFQPPPHERKKSKGGAASIFAIFGALVGLALAYFGTQGEMLWLIVGLGGGLLIGWLIGRNIDKSADKKR